MNVEMKDLGKWTEFTLSNDQGMSLSVLNYGGIITKLLVPDRNGQLENVVLGYANIQDFEFNPNYFGSLVGRVAGRIQGAAFELDGKTYQLAANDGKNHLHGGPDGFNQVIWDVTPFQDESSVGLRLTHTSEDGEGGYPGTVKVEVTYTLTQDNQLVLDYNAKSDQTTPLTLTNHSYFNLSGNGKNTIADHRVTMDSSKFVELDGELIPTGKLVNVAGTPFDFRESRVIGDGLNSQFYQNAVASDGYDHYFIFDHQSEKQVTVEDPASGRVMTIQTNQPGVVMYTSNMLGDGLALAETSSRRYHGVCFETQASPGSLHHPEFPSVILKAGEKYQKQTVFAFSAK